jgi:hypothetical protein
MTNDLHNSSFLLCFNKKESSQLKYLPAFQLFATYLPTVHKYSLSLVNFAGKLLDNFTVELDGNLIDTVLPDFVQNLFDGNLVLCQGILLHKPLTKDILIEELKSEIVIRSRKCGYAVLKGNTLCQECIALETCKTKRGGTKRTLRKKTAQSIREFQTIDNSVEGKQITAAVGPGLAYGAWASLVGAWGYSNHSLNSPLLKGTICLTDKNLSSN